MGELDQLRGELGRDLQGLLKRGAQVGQSGAMEAARSLGLEELVGLVVGVPILGVVLWLVLRQAGLALLLGLGALIGLLLLVVVLLAVVRVVATLRMARTRRTYVALASEHLHQEALAALIQDLLSGRRRQLRWLDWRACAFSVVHTVSRSGRPLCLWQLPQRWEPVLKKAASRVRGLRLIALEDVPEGRQEELLPRLGRGRHEARLELEPAHEAYPLAEPLADPAAANAWMLSRVDVCENEHLTQVTSFLPLPPGEIRPLRQRLLRGAERLRRHLERELTGVAATVDRGIEKRSLTSQLGGDDARFRMQILVRAGADYEERAEQLVESAYANWEQWSGQENWLRARGHLVAGSLFVGGPDSRLRRWWFDGRLEQGLIRGGAVVRGQQFTRLFRPWREEELPAPAVSEGAEIATSDEGRAIALAAKELVYNLHLLGPIGRGKTTVIERMVLEDVEQMRCCIYIEYKGDSVERLLERIPWEHRDRVVLVDFTRSDFAVGSNILDCPDESQREVVVDQVIELFARLFSDSWRYRQEEICRAGLMTLLEHPGTTLCDLPVLLLDQRRRREWTADLRDPALRAFWRWYGDLSDAEREKVAGPLLAKLRQLLLLRRPVRRMLGQAQSQVDLDQLVRDRAIVLVRLPKGQGAVTAALLGALWVIQVWQAILRRGPSPHHELVRLIVDEAQNLSQLIPQTLVEMLAEDRGYQLGVTLAHQYLAQLKDARAGVEANTLNLIVFALELEADAIAFSKRLAPFGPEDLMGLGRFRCVAKLCHNGQPQTPVVGNTSPLGEGQGSAYAEALALHSVRRWGRDAGEVDRDFEAGVDGRLLQPAGRGEDQGDEPWNL